MRGELDRWFAVQGLYRAHVLERTDAVCERFPLVSVERRVRNDAVDALVESARRDLFL